MEGSDKKKIILKRRLRQNVDDGGGFEDAVSRPPVATSTDSEPDSKHFFEGEIFDQYHRPLRVVGGVDRLKEIAARPLGLIVSPPRESSRQREALIADRQAIAEAVAHHIYKLAQKDRETQLDVYLSAFNVALAGRTCQESRDILLRANEFFTEHYYAAVRERGERPEIYHQILKRVGHTHGERLSKIVFGLDVEDMAKQLWALFHSSHPDKTARINDILLDCTEMQVEALREEFLRLPFKDLALQLFGVLRQSAADSSATTRRTIGKSELQEHKRSAAFRVRDQVRALRYLLLGRTPEELSLVKRYYLELGDQRLSDSELSLDADVRRALPPAEVERLGRLLHGWTAHEEAEEINKILFGSISQGRPDDTASDPRDAVVRDHTQGLGPFLRRFKKSRLVEVSDSVNALTRLAYPFLRERIAAMSYSQFMATNQALREFYGYELDPTLFPSLELFDARRRAVTVYERMWASNDFLEMVEPLEFLDHRRCLAVQMAFNAIFGMPLRAALEDQVKEAGFSISQSEFEGYIGRYVEGHGRWSLSIDLLSLYRDNAFGGGVWDHDFVVSSHDQELALRIGELVDRDVARGELDHQIRELLVGLSVDALHRVERAFFEMTEPSTPLVGTLQEVMSSDASSVIMLLLSGVEVSRVLEELRGDPKTVTRLRDLPSRDIAFIRESFKKIYFIDLVDHVVTSRGEVEDRDIDVILEAVGILLKPEILSARRTLGFIRKESASDIDMIRNLCGGMPERVMGFERGYDVLFPTFRVHLKLAAARMAIPVSMFSELILLLEGVEPDLPQRILECFDSVDIELLQEILRSHRRGQRVVEECYDLLYPERTLRHALKEMNVDQDLINETLLHLEGYCSRSVAQELGRVTNALSGDDLGTAIIETLSARNGDEENRRIPQDINWMDEMIYQIGLAYRRLYGESLVAVCRKRGVGSEQLEDLTGRLYGLEVAASARELFTLIKCSKEGTQPPEGAEARVSAYLETRGPKYRERLMAAYQAHWSHHPGFGGLLDDMTQYFKDSASKRRLLAMFLSTSSDVKTMPTNAPDIH